MANELFAVLEEDAQDRSTHRACLRAVARTQKQLGAFFKQAADESDFMSRLDLVHNKIEDIVREACIEEGSVEFDKVTRVLSSELARTSEVLRDTPQDADVAPSDGENDELVEHVRGANGRKLVGLPSQFEENGGKFDDKKSTKTATPGRRNPWDVIRDMTDDIAQLEQQLRDAGITPFTETRDLEEETLYGGTDPESGNAGGAPAAPGTAFPESDYTHGSTRIAVETGDTYTQETVDLPSAGLNGLSEEPSPKIDKGNAGDENHTSQKPIDIPSVQHNPEQQDITEHADYTAPLETPGVVKSINADMPLQAEHNVAPNTQVFPNKDQATPVTSKWKVVE